MTAKPLTPEEEREWRATAEMDGPEAEPGLWTCIRRLFSTLDAARARCAKVETRLHDALGGLPEKIDVLARLYLEDNCYDLHDKKSRETLERDGWQYVMPAYPVDHAESLERLLETAMQSERVLRMKAKRERDAAQIGWEDAEKRCAIAECEREGLRGSLAKARAEVRLVAKGIAGALGEEALARSWVRRLRQSVVARKERGA